MARWVAKAVIQKSISYLPFKHSINFFFQKYITRGVELTDALFESKLKHCFQHISALKNQTSFKENFIALELGSGWYPIVPVGLYLCGADRIYSADIKSTLTEKNIYHTIEKFISYSHNNTLQMYLPDVLETRILELKQLYKKQYSKAELLTKIHCEQILGDITKKDLENIHLINSNNTFEHIPSDILNTILHYFRKIIHPQGVMSHFIDLSDHFSHLDNSISNYNFLKFSDRQWKWIDNSIQPQNRLRISHYRELLKQSGWIIQSEETISAQEEKVTSINPAKQYRDISEKDIAVTHALIICTPS